MHTEIDTSRTEAFIARYRAEVAMTAGAALTLALILAWAILAPILGFASDNLTAAISLLAGFSGFIAGIAFYWGAE